MSKFQDRTSKEIAEFFDSIAGEYEELTYKHSLKGRFFSRLFNGTIRALSPTANDVVLDIGCGTGTY